MSLLFSGLLALATLLLLAWPGLRRTPGPDGEKTDAAQPAGSAGISNTCRR